VIRKILACDVLVLATDNMRSRALVSRVGVQHAIPVVSAGIDLPRHGERLGHAGGHVADQVAGTPCLDCLGLIDRQRLEREEADTVLTRHRYDDAPETEAAEPSAHMFNTVIAGASCAEVCQILTGALREPGAAAYLMFDARALTFQRVRAKATRDCGICVQVRDQGDRFDLPIGRPATAA
jgi:molybdopterin/thiamine biosynthesis adenylyltransferase